MNDHEQVPLGIETLRYLRRLARAPMAWAQASTARDLPLPHDTTTCWCISCHAARLVHAHVDDLDPDYQPEPEEVSMFSKKSKAETPPTLPCSCCGVAVEVEPGARGWPTCSTCMNASNRELLSAMLASLGVEHPADDEAVSAVFAGRLFWRASTNRAMSQTIDQSGRNRSGEYVGSPGDHSAPRGSGNTTPWEHVDPKQVRRLITEAQRELHPHPRPLDTREVCGGCGVRASITWVRTTRDAGIPAIVLCDPCGKEWIRAGLAGPLDLDHGDADDARALAGWRDRLAADALRIDHPDVVWGLAYLVSFSPFYDTADVDETGYATRWGYLDPEAVEHARQTVWSRWPHLAPKDWQARQRRRLEAEALVLASTPAPTPTKGPGLAPPRTGT